ncbi:hypothetical protein ACQPW3_11665 [Actinosynnema sp. CA-248983]
MLAREGVITRNREPEQTDQDVDRSETQADELIDRAGHESSSTSSAVTRPSAPTTDRIGRRPQDRLSSGVRQAGRSGQVVRGGRRPADAGANFGGRGR